MAEYKGIDVSKYQGTVDFKKVKSAGNNFVILRVGTGYGHEFYLDSKFEANYKNAKAAGLNVGTYFYSYATSEAEAKQEAQWVIDAIKGKQFEYPVYFDMEEKSVSQLGKNKCSKIADAFCSALEKAGYYVGIYASKYWLDTFFNANIFKNYDIWVAQWGKSCTFSKEYGVWQYSAEGKVDGISGDVDLDKCYKNYPEIIKKAKLNGFTGETKAEEKPKTEAAKPAQKQETKPAAAAKTTNVVYTVKRGDTLTKIANKYKTTYKVLAQYNKLSNPNLLQIGQKIVIPNVKVEQYVEYKVKSGDTLSKIAKKYGTTYIKLAAYNKLANPNKIYVGQIIKIPK